MATSAGLERAEAGRASAPKLEPAGSETVRLMRLMLERVPTLAAATLSLHNALADAPMPAL